MILTCHTGRRSKNTEHTEPMKTSDHILSHLVTGRVKLTSKQKVFEAHRTFQKHKMVSESRQSTINKEKWTEERTANQPEYWGGEERGNIRKAKRQFTLLSCYDAFKF